MASGVGRIGIFVCAVRTFVRTVRIVVCTVRIGIFVRAVRIVVCTVRIGVRAIRIRIRGGPFTCRTGVNGLNLIVGQAF